MPRIAILQIDVSDDENPQDRFERVINLLNAQKGKCDIAILPELWMDGAFNIERSKKNAQSIMGEFVTSLSLAAKQAGIWLHAGSFSEKEAGKTFNTSLLIKSDGTVAHTYRKIHLFGFEGGEASEFASGTNVEVSNHGPLGNVGLSTCYDLRFPELFRAMLDKDVETFLVSSGWPEARLAHWQILLQARAIENQTWVVACNEVGINGDVVFGGHSMVINPLGEIIFEAGNEQGVFYVDIDLSLVAKTRKNFPVLEDRVLG